MPIYDLTGFPKKTQEQLSFSEEKVTCELPVHKESDSKEKSTLLSSFIARLFFFVLLLLDLLWGIYCLFLLIIGSIGSLLTIHRVAFFTRLQKKGGLSLRRSLVCALALLVALFSPAFGIMIACTYFLMYDKGGIEEVIPAALQEQFREFFN